MRTQHSNSCSVPICLTLGLKTCGSSNTYDKSLLRSFIATVKICRVWNRKWRKEFNTGTLRDAGGSVFL